MANWWTVNVLVRRSIKEPFAMNLLVVLRDSPYTIEFALLSAGFE